MFAEAAAATTTSKNSISFALIHLYSFQMIYFLNARLISVIDIHGVAASTGITLAQKNKTQTVKMQRKIKQYQEHILC